MEVMQTWLNFLKRTTGRLQNLFQNRQLFEMYNSNKPLFKPTELPIIKNSEDDTFRILARPSFDEMTMLFKECGLKPYQRLEFAKKYGWTWSEYARVCRQKGLVLSI